jgi:hypothetical protein
MVVYRAAFAGLFSLCVKRLQRDQAAQHDSENDACSEQ